jgi:hypothetical protein
MAHNTQGSQKFQLPSAHKLNLEGLGEVQQREQVISSRNASSTKVHIACAESLGVSTSSGPTPTSTLFKTLITSLRGSVNFPFAFFLATLVSFFGEVSLTPVLAERGFRGREERLVGGSAGTTASIFFRLRGLRGSGDGTALRRLDLRVGGFIFVVIDEEFE